MVRPSWIPMFAIVATCALVSATPVRADDDVKGEVDASKMGNLDQHDLTVCKTKTGDNLSCGPAAAVNSFVYLEKMFPSIYGETLAPLSKPLGQALGQVTVGNLLGGKDFMQTAAPGGTFWDNFYKGKQDYINDKDPGSTLFDQETNPSAVWLADQLNHDSDVEILLNFDSPSFRGHYVTVTRISYDSLLGFGVLYFVDPLDGTVHHADITGDTAQLDITYVRPDTKEELRGRIVRGAGEFARGVPEPATWALMLSGLGLVGVGLRRARRRHLGSTGSVTEVSRSQLSH